jgi:hypothetical protein
MKFLRIFPLVILFTNTISGQIISNYIPFTGWGVRRNNSDEVIILRRFAKDGHTCYLTVSPKSLDTKILSADSININPSTWTTIRIRYSSTPYFMAMKQAEKYSDTLQDAGFKRFLPSQKGIDITIDLCQIGRAHV